MDREVTVERRGQAPLGEWWAALRALRHERWHDTWGVLFVLPAMVLLILFQGWPIIRGLSLAFQDYRFLRPGQEHFNGLENFQEAFADKTYWSSLVHSLHFAALYIPASLILALLAGTLVSKLGEGIEVAAYRVILYLPVVLPSAVGILLWKQLFNQQFGYVNYFLRDVLGLNYAPGWLSDPDYSIPTLVIIDVWKSLGMNILLILVGLYNINRELYEAAAIDGANAFQSWWGITLPLLRPSLTIILVLSTGVLQVTQQPLILFGQTAGPDAAAMTAGLYAYQQAFLVGDMRWGYAAAVSLTVGIVSMTLSALIFWALRSERTD